MATYSQVIYQLTGAAAQVTLNRPDKRNALGEQLVGELKSALREAEADERARVVVLRGAGKDFCAGADLSQLEQAARASVLDNRESAGRAAELFLQLRRLKKPVIARVHGRALAGGAGLASACDLVIAARSAQFAYPEVKIGFVAAMVMAFLRRNLGEKRALELLATGRLVSAEEAAALGLINRVCDDTELETELARLVSELTPASASAVMLTKRLLYQIDAMSFEQAIGCGVEVNALARMTDDCQNGSGSFWAKLERQQ
jgi:methylglutaconyl-CoA hydratase